MSFLLGCNYLETQNGTAMWKSFNEESIREDLKVLQEHGVEILRVFPNWRDFQPVIKMYGQNGRLFEYRMQDETLPLNSYYLDEAMMQKFIRFCCIAESYGMKLIVGLLTGWLSSRLFIPEALGDKNLFTDPQALILEQKFVSGFVKYTKDIPNIYGWDLGNECNNLSTAISREEAFCWSAVISNAIRAQDNTRPVISGMHGLEPEGIWRISDQAETTDILTTHPYPLWVEHCTNDAVSSVRTLLHATAQTVYYASVGGKPCLVEEIGTMGPMVCSDQIAAGFLKANLFSNWANGAPGLLWWCSSDQNLLSHAPYDWAMCERELGLMDARRIPKPALKELGNMKRFLEKLRVELGGELPRAQVDAVCILTRGQDPWGIAYTSYILAKQAGINLEFAYIDRPFPEAQMYLLPCVTGNMVMSKSSYEALKARIRDGAGLYVSLADGFLTEFAQLTGMQVVDTQLDGGDAAFTLGTAQLTIKRRKTYTLRPVGGRILCEMQGEPILTENTFGKGTVYTLNAPLEESLIEAHNGFDRHLHEIYRKVFAHKLAAKPFVCLNDRIGVTFHPDGDAIHAVLINYSGLDAAPQAVFQNGYSIKRVLYGDFERLSPFDACVVQLGR